MKSLDKIALIIPLRLTAGTYEGELRLRRICATVPQDLFEISISDYGTADEHRGPIRALEAEGIRVVRHPSPHPLFSIGHARDFGVQMADAPVILFNDIDFFGTEAMYRAIHAEAVRRELHRNLFDFFCVPVLFLTDAGTRQWLVADEGCKPFGDGLTVDTLEQAAEQVQSTAYGSSAMVINRHHYLSLGGHDPRFSGHGAEDYDLLHRLAAIRPKGPRPHDYYTDYKDNGVRNYWGFRPLFALYGLDLLARGLHLVHLWHPRRMEKGYFRPAANFRLLRRIMKRFDRTGEQPMPLADLGHGERWGVLYRDRRDLGLLRQILPLSGGYDLIKARSFGNAEAMARRIDGFEAAIVIAAPGVTGDAGLLRTKLRQSTRMLQMTTTEGEGTFAFTELPTTGAVVKTKVVAAAKAVHSPAGRSLFTFWPHLAIDGLPVLVSGRLDPPEDLGSPLFKSFGGENIRTGSRRSRPARKRKSSAWIRLKRWFTGY